MELTIFNEAKKVLWEESELRKIARGQHVSLKVLIKKLNLEAGMMGLSVKAFKKYRFYYRNFRRLLDLDEMPFFQRKRAYYYYQRYASLEEKKEFISYAKNNLENIIKHCGSKEELDLYLLEVGISDYDLYVFMQVHDIDTSIKNKIMYRFKKYYDGYVTDRMDNKGELSINEYGLLAKYYAKEVLGLEVTIKRKNLYKKDIYFILDDLISKGNIDGIKEIFEQRSVTPQEIVSYCYCYKGDMVKSEQQRLERMLLTCLKNVKSKDMVDYHNPNTYDIYVDYLSQNLNYILYCAKIGMDINNFRHKPKTLKNEEIAKALEVRILRETKEHLDEQTYYCKELVKAIKEGITINGVKRKFNLFDYFYYFGEYQIHQFFIPKLPLSQPEKTILNKFFAPLKNANYLNQDIVLNSVYEFSPKLDSKGNPIKGTGRVLSVEELQSIVDIFLDKNIPLYDILVSIAVRCYAKDALIEEMALQRK